MKHKKILVIGAGWYGCHIALYLKNLGHNIIIFEKNKDIFLGSSGYNQFRLHTGYHYPRSSDTINETKINYLKFKRLYKKFIYFPKNNIYCIANKKSLIDSESYKTLIRAQKLKVKIKSFKFFNDIEDSFISNEGVLLNNKIKNFYKKKLKDNLFFKKKVKDIKKLRKEYDFILDCSNSTFKNKLNNNFKYVLTISLVYKKRKNHTIYPITIMDGELPSLYPYADKKNFYTLTHSKYTHIKRFRSINALELFKKKINKKEISKIKNNMEKEIINYFPKFKKLLTYKTYFLSYKVLPNEKSAKRSIFISRDRNLIMCTSPKITNIFSFQDYIEKII